MSNDAIISEYVSDLLKQEKYSKMGKLEFGPMYRTDIQTNFMYNHTSQERANLEKILCSTFR
jgi:hypothetical protein